MTNENRTPAGVPTGGQFAASAKTESGLVLGESATKHEEPFTAVGDCPDCGESMVGHVNDGKFVPGSTCDHCKHEVAFHRWQHGPLSPSLNFHVYEIEDDGYIRVTEDDETVEVISPSDATWPRLVREQGFDPLSFQRAHLAVNDQHAFVEAETKRFGYANMAGPYSVLLDRERVPAHVLIERACDPHALAEDDGTMEGYAIDRLYVPEDRSDDEDFYDVTDERWTQIEAACDEAGLGVMKDVYESMVGREILHRDQVVDAESVTNDYDNVVGPAIDRIEDALIDEHGEQD